MTRTKLRASPEARLLAGLEALQMDTALSDPLLRFLAELQKWNVAYNLSAVRDPADMVTRHVLDSLVIGPLVRGTVLDVGSGAGLPAIPLAIADPGRAVTALDSNGKKARFLRHVQRTLALENLEVVEARAEAHRVDPGYGTVTCRAFGSLEAFLAATASLAAPDGQWLAMKGKVSPPMHPAVPEGFHIVSVTPLTVPGLDETRHAVCVARRQ